MLTTWKNPNPIDPLAWIGRVVTTVAYLEIGYRAWLAAEKAEDWHPVHRKDNWLRSMAIVIAEADAKYNPSDYRKRKARLAKQ